MKNTVIKLEATRRWHTVGKTTRERQSAGWKRNLRRLTPLPSNSAGAVK